MGAKEKTCCEVKSDNVILCLRGQYTCGAFQCTKENRGLCHSVDALKCCQKNNSKYCTAASTCMECFGLFTCGSGCHCESPTACLSGKGKICCLFTSCSVPCSKEHTPMECGCCGAMCMEAEAPQEPAPAAERRIDAKV